jgi:hypothetical protein
MRCRSGVTPSALSCRSNFSPRRMWRPALFARIASALLMHYKCATLDKFPKLCVQGSPSPAASSNDRRRRGWPARGPAESWVVSVSQGLAAFAPASLATTDCGAAIPPTTVLTEDPHPKSIDAPIAGSHRQEQANIATVTMFHDGNGAEAERADYCRRLSAIILWEETRAVRAMIVPSLIDADDRAIGRKIIALCCEAIVKEDQPPFRNTIGAPWSYLSVYSLMPRTSYNLCLPLELLEFAAVGASNATAAARNGICEVMHDVSSHTQQHEDVGHGLR